MRRFRRRCSYIHPRRKDLGRGCSLAGPNKTAQEIWIEELNRLGSLWIHDGNPKRPHALLTSGKHSDGFFNASLLVEQPVLLSSACLELISVMRSKMIAGRVEDALPVGRVVGSALGAVTIAHEVARHLKVKCGYTESVDGQMHPKRFDVTGEQVLVVEDVMTTGGTTRKTVRALEAEGATVLPVIGCIVNRSGKSHLDGRPIVALVSRKLPIWAPEECPLCRAGSEALRPKANWAELNAQYKEVPNEVR